MEQFNPGLCPPGYYPYSGFLNIYKEAGYTSMDVCAKLRGILRMKKIGHAGTLDPMAEGVLPVALGRATKDVDRIGDGTKTYRAGMLLGVVTDTQDTTGSVLSETPVSEETLTEEAVRAAALSFIGPYEQLTPMYSARKVNGKKLYEYARAGKEVERKRKSVEILEIVIEEIRLPHVVMTVTCTKGTYIRTLCHDIGEKLGVGACMESLLRTRVGDFALSEALTLSEIEAARDRGGIDALLSVKTPTAVAIGKFDGCHLGHRKLFARLRSLAQEEGLKTCAVVLDFGKPMLLDPEERRRELCLLGIDYVIELPFTEALRGMRAETFVREVLVRQLCMKVIVAGPDLGFGRNREGNAALLSRLSAVYGYRTETIPKLRLPASDPLFASCRALLEKAAGQTGGEADADAAEEGVVISSSLIRLALSEGELGLVEALLGKPYALSGTVIHGRHLGEPVLGFPTMNVVAAKNRALPPYGVYAVRAALLPEKETRGRGAETLPVYDGISDLGVKPTVADADDYDPERVELETNLFAYHGDAYGRRLRVEFEAFLRPERPFSGLSELREQLLFTDVPEAKNILAKRERP